MIEAWLGGRRGIVSVCSAHPLVIETALSAAAGADGPVLIEATCNQVNQHGGYTGMDPAAFRVFVERLAERAGLSPGRLLLGGDHLGPNPWTSLPAEAAMAEAGTMVEAYVAAGFGKLHLDTSMACADDPRVLEEATVAARAARLAAVADRAAKANGVTAPVYVVGTEVPTPGGALKSLGTLAVTTPEAARRTLAAHAAAFAALGLHDAMARVIAVVVQPGVEFGHARVVDYAPERAAGLSAALRDMPGVSFEAHSTDYQRPDALRALVRDGFAILKVGPGLTFAMREALYGLDRIAEALDPGGASLPDAMEAIMLAHPEHWRRHYHGDPASLRVMRHYSYSDRIRYYWTDPGARAAVTALLARLDAVEIPETLTSQYLPTVYARMRSEGARRTAPEMLRGAVRAVLDDYAAAVAP